MLLIGVLVLGLGFIYSYVAAFHQPRPHRVDVVVVAPANQAPRIAARLNALPGSPLRARLTASEADARRMVKDGQTTAALIVEPRGSGDRLLIAGGAGSALGSAVQAVLGKVNAEQHRSLVSTDVAPLQNGDYRGLTGFYLVVGWLVAGYLAAAILGITLGPRASTLGQARARLLMIVPYAIVAGLGGALIVDAVLGAQSGHVLAIAAVGALLVYAAASVTIALETLMGIAGIGLAILLFVVLGNPSAGGAYQNQLLPGFWRTIGNALPNGAGVDTVRRLVYFDGHGIAGHLIVICAYSVVAIGVTLLVTQYRARRRAPEAEQTGTRSELTRTALAN